MWRVGQVPGADRSQEPFLRHDLGADRSGHRVLHRRAEGSVASLASSFDRPHGTGARLPVRDLRRAHSRGGQAVHRLHAVPVPGRSRDRTCRPVGRCRRGTARMAGVPRVSGRALSPRPGDREVRVSPSRACRGGPAGARRVPGSGRRCCARCVGGVLRPRFQSSGQDCPGRNTRTSTAGVSLRGDLGERLRRGVPTAGRAPRGITSPSRWGPRRAAGSARGPAPRAPDRDARREASAPSRRPAAERRRSGRDFAHRREQVGVAREVHRPAAGDHVAHGLRPPCAQAPADGVLGVRRPHPHHAEVHLLAGADLADDTEPAPAEQAPAPAGTSTRAPWSSRSREGRSRWS